ncbi:MAG: hypothetical protein ACJ76R_09830 [Solirubrobacteraceae bacterium]
MADAYAATVTAARSPMTARYVADRNGELPCDTSQGHYYPERGRQADRMSATSPRTPNLRLRERKNVSEEHQIAGSARGEPLSADQIGVRVRVPLSGAPSAHWSRVLSAHLVTELTGHSAVGHMHLDNVVRGSEIVLDGVEEPEADCLGPVIARAVAAANHASLRSDAVPQPCNVAAADAERIARKVSLTGQTLGQ